MFSDQQRAWMSRVVKPAQGGAAGGGPGGGAQKMTPECKPVHGKVPGPQNHLLCAAHGHILDVAAQTVIAANLKDYMAKFPRGAHGGGAGPAHGPASPANGQGGGQRGGGQGAAPDGGGLLSGINQVVSAVGTVASQGIDHMAAAQASAPQAASQPAGGQAAAPNPHDVEAGKTMAAEMAKQYATEKYARVINAMVRWQNEQEKVLRKEDAEPGGILGTLLKIAKIVETGVKLAFPEAKALEVVVEVAGLTGDVAEMSNDKSAEAMKKAQEKMKGQVMDQISDMVNSVLAKQNMVLIAADKAIRATLPTLDSDPKIAQMLATNKAGDIEIVVTKALGVKSTQKAGDDIAKMLIQMDHAMMDYRKRLFVDQKMNQGGSFGKMVQIGSIGDDMRKKFGEEFDEEHSNYE